ncbi:MAG: hypothetical protein KDI44_02040 [Thiothrix sp.]|nr:hypothetical protein [Thiothrix sp.]
MNQVLQQAFFRIMKALMHILYRKGVAYKDFIHLAKQAYLEVVEDELLAAGERPTTTRMAAITGLTRKDVAWLKQNLRQDTGITFNRSQRVVQGWVNDPEFLDAAGEPGLLAFRGEKSSFEALVRRYSGDMSCFAMLDEMKRINMVKADAEDRISLQNKVYIPHGDEPEKIRLLGTDVALLIDTIEHNLTRRPGDELYYQRKVSYNRIPESVTPEFRAFVRQDAQNLLVRFNTWLAGHDRDSNPRSQGRGRNMQAGVGIFYFERPAAKQEVEHEN